MHYDKRKKRSADEYVHAKDKESKQEEVVALDSGSNSSAVSGGISFFGR
jgi:hypothetical protein